MDECKQSHKRLVHGRNALRPQATLESADPHDDGRNTCCVPAMAFPDAAESPQAPP